jgi:hypothetical protein
VEVWNTWREKKPDILIDLSGAKLMHMNLEEFLEKKWGGKIFFIWWLFAECGRSLGQRAGWSL